MPIEVIKTELKSEKVERFAVPEGKTRRIPTHPKPGSVYNYDTIVIKCLMDYVGGEIYHLQAFNLPGDKRMKVPESALDPALRHEHIIPGDPTTVSDFIYDKDGEPVYELQFSAPRSMPRGAI